MDVLKALILGIVQGLTEFIPVSSSGHLTLAQQLLGFDMDKEKAMLMTFDIMVHLATALGIIIYYMEDIWDMVKTQRRQLLYLAVASVPAAIVGIFFIGFFEAAKADPLKIGIGFVGTAIFLIGGEVFAVKGDDVRERVKFIDAILIGIAQAAALMPGVSRSGATIGSALICGVNRTKAVQFSFLLGIPAFLGAAGWKLATFEPVSGAVIGFPAIAVGTVTAFALTFVAIPLTIKIVRRRWLRWFALYCGLLGASVIAYDMFKAS